MRKPSASIALVALLFAPACGPPGPAADASVCTNPCSCAERGPPDFSREGLGTPAAGADARQLAALVRTNHWRTAAGIAPMNGDAQIQSAAAAHAQLMATTSQSQCWPGVHNETAGCPGFTGQGPGDRMTAAGYQWSMAGEVINWESSPQSAIDGWMWTVYHRLPFMDYEYTDSGYAYADGPFGGRPATHNVMDFGAPRSPHPTTPTHPVVFPVPGLTAVPPSFQGWLEGPTPPWPGGGAWPSGRTSGTVISMHFPSDAWTVTEH
ncbi:MAG: CAP domain-containing protein, partial [Deltaproteobacteria bacterium]